jgi:outer membrane protein assembly factor BamA
MLRQIAILLIFSFIIFNETAAQSTDTLHTKVDHTIIPIAFYLPETGFAFGATGILTMRFAGETVESRPSQILYSAAYTLKNQLLLFVPFDLYYKNEDYRLKGELGYYRYFYNYYGIGSSSRLSDKTDYNVNFPRIQAVVYRRVYQNFYAGIGYRFDNFDIQPHKPNTILSNSEVIGYFGGNISNLMLSLVYDSRDHVFDTKKGIMLDFVTEISMPNIGSDFIYNKYTLDLRTFHPISKSISMAYQALISTVGDKAPFFVYPYISSPNHGRGFADRRFIDRSMMSLQAEIRFPIYRRFSGVSFISTSGFNDEIGTGLFTDQKIAGGFGLRYLLNQIERTSIRLDAGFTNESFNFYITVNEAF